LLPLKQIADAFEQVGEHGGVPVLHEKVAPVKEAPRESARRVYAPALKRFGAHLVVVHATVGGDVDLQRPARDMAARFVDGEVGAQGRRD
jgi:hypothetical protein